MDFSRRAPSPGGFEVPWPPVLSPGEGDFLVRIAFSAIRRQWDPELARVPVPEGGPLGEPAGAFVTLYRGESLRGCLGMVSSPDPLWRTVDELALASATRDPRFDPVAEDELPDLRLEISVLGPLARLRAFDPDLLASGIQVGEHGLLIRSRVRSGLLLPQVAVRYGWDSIRFLEETCAKAGLLQGAWREDGVEVCAFRCAIFKGAAEPGVPGLRRA